MPSEAAEVEASAAAAAAFTPQLRIVDGEIVLDQDSLHVSAARGAADLAGGGGGIEEGEAMAITSCSYLNRSP